MPVARCLGPVPTRSRPVGAGGQGQLNGGCAIVLAVRMEAQAKVIHVGL